MNRFGAALLLFSAVMTAWIGADSLKTRRDKTLEKRTQSLYTVYRCGEKTTSRLTDFIQVKFPDLKARLVTDTPSWFDRRVPVRIQVGEPAEKSQSFRFLVEPGSKLLTPLDGPARDFLRSCRRWASSPL
ncbi:MAG: hypothetical protein VYA30_07530 [Myxococcota bacterium]|nr:hypothetical protein [Myxococcota bacterium]